MNIVFELVLINMMPPRTRLRVLGSATLANLMHVTFLLGNLIIHWGTLVGTMSGVMAFCASIVTVHFARKAYGFITGTNYHVGWIKYSVEELR
jgi:uncharacterized membrane protein YkgB